MKPEDLVMKDLRATTNLEVSWTWEADGSLSVVSPSASGNRWPASDEGDIAWLADHLQDQFVIEQIGRAWPRCIVHGRHPMKAIAQDRAFLWVCPQNLRDSVPIGELVDSQVPEPRVGDNRIRWFRDDWGWGVIAHSEGDIWFHFTAVEKTKRYELLSEDQLVQCELVQGPHGAFRDSAHKVRIVESG